MIQSSGYKTEYTIIWQLQDQQLDFGLSEFAELTAFLKQGGLFDYLKENRPALLSTLHEIFRPELEQGIWESDDLEYNLEIALRNLALRLEHE